MNGHTPGPWSFKGGEPFVRNSAGRIVAQIKGSPDVPQEEWLAATHLIAATPEMLKALENAADYLRGGFIVCQCCGEEVPTTDTDAESELRAAIAKARGEV